MTADDNKRTLSPKDALWASVGLASLLIVGAVILISLGKDVSALMTVAATVALPILVGLGGVLYNKVESVNQNVNGRLSRLIEHAINSKPLDEKE